MKCTALSDGSHFIQLTSNQKANFWLLVIGLLAAFLNVWFAFLIQRHKELQAHPMNLFKWIAVGDAIYFSN
jgi:hypothetical protein